MIRKRGHECASRRRMNERVLFVSLGRLLYEHTDRQTTGIAGSNIATCFSTSGEMGPQEMRHRRHERNKTRNGRQTEVRGATPLENGRRTYIVRSDEYAMVRAICLCHIVIRETGGTTTEKATHSEEIVTTNETAGRDRRNR